MQFKYANLNIQQSVSSPGTDGCVQNILFWIWLWVAMVLFIVQQYKVGNGLRGQSHDRNTTWDALSLMVNCPGGWGVAKWSFHSSHSWYIPSPNSTSYLGGNLMMSLTRILVIPPNLFFFWPLSLYLFGGHSSCESQNQSILPDQHGLQPYPFSSSQSQQRSQPFPVNDVPGK